MLNIDMQFIVHLDAYCKTSEKAEYVKAHLHIFLHD